MEGIADRDKSFNGNGDNTVDTSWKMENQTEKDPQKGNERDESWSFGPGLEEARKFERLHLLLSDRVISFKLYRLHQISSCKLFGPVLPEPETIKIFPGCSRNFFL